MASQRGVWVVTSDPATAESVNSALRADGRLVTEGVCPNLADLSAHLEHATAAAVLVDIDPHPRQTLGALEPIINRFSATRFVVVSQSMPGELVLEAMQIGSRHFLTKASIPSELGSVLHRLIPNGALVADRRGIALTLLSAAGGCGVTTLAVNLAQELHLLGATPTLLIDLDVAYGGAATYLGVEGQFGLADVLAYQGPIDAQLVTSTASAYSKGLHVLLSPASVHPVDPPALNFGRLRQAMAACKQAYACAVLDASRVPVEVAAGLAQNSEMTLLVFQQTVRDVRRARVLLGALHTHGIPADTVIPMINRYQKRGPVLSLEEIHKGLGAMPMLRVSNDFKSAIRGANYGKPLSEVAPRSAARKDLVNLAGQVLESRAAHRPMKAAQ